MSMNEGMATLTENSQQPLEAGHDPSKVSRVLVALAIATAIVLVLLFALGFTFGADTTLDVVGSIEGELRSWVATHR